MTNYSSSEHRTMYAPSTSTVFDMLRKYMSWCILIEDDIQHTLYQLFRYIATYKVSNIGKVIDFSGNRSRSICCLFWGHF